MSTISGATTFTVVTGPNPNYPNPPAWGLSYHVNGQESPLLEVVRGTEYTFIVEVRSKVYAQDCKGNAHFPGVHCL